MDLVYNYLQNELKLKKEDTIVIGVSAGPDSMFLLYILIELRKIINFQIIVAHINHNVRVESVEEEEFLKNYCLENNIEFCSMKIEKYNKENFHAYARKIRYDFYQELISKYQANYLMTAHHGDDLMETILMRLTRGSTLKGYGGISILSEMEGYKIARPLLYLTKEEIKEMDDKLHIPYRIDKSNASDKYTRNRYRKYVLPFLKEENKDVHLKFLKFSSLLGSLNEHIDKEVNEAYLLSYKNNKLDLIIFREYDSLIQKMILEKILENLYSNMESIMDKHIDLLLNLINKSKTGNSINLPSNIVATLEYNYLVFMNIEDVKDYYLELKNGLVIPNGMKFVDLKEKENGNDTLHLNSSMVKLPLYVRNKRNGDFIELKGTNGTKKVSDIFIDCKIPRNERMSYPVVVDSNNKIVWIPKLKKSKYDVKNNDFCDIIIKCL